MKQIEVHTTTTEKYYCDVCGKELSGKYDIGRTSGAGDVNDGGIYASYGYNITVGKSLGRVEHVCRDCLRAIMKSILENV